MLPFRFATDSKEWNSYVIPCSFLPLGSVMFFQFIWYPYELYDFPYDFLKLIFSCQDENSKIVT